MLVRTIMSSPVISVHQSTQVGEALELLKQKNIRRLPVIDDSDRLVGLATEWDMLKIFFGCKTDRFQTNLISRTPVSAVMYHDPITTNPDETVEEAALIMEKEKISTLPVLDNGHLVGIISLTDILRALIDVLGLEDSSLRITLKYERHFGFLTELVKLIDDCEVLVENIVTFHQTLVLKVKNQNTEKLLNLLKEKGYQLEHITYLGKGLEV